MSRTNALNEEVSVFRISLFESHIRVRMTSTLLLPESSISSSKFRVFFKQGKRFRSDSEKVFRILA